jgi:dihydrofolate reductase
MLGNATTGFMPPLLRVVGYAIVSADGMIADAAGRMPPEIVNEADQQFFSRGLDEVDLVVHGRNSQEQQRHSPRRQRLVVTRQVAALAPHPDNPRALLWNPNGAMIEDACEALGVSHGVAAVIGGTDVFGLFLAQGYDAFHLSRVAAIVLPGGRPVFPGVPARSPEALLADHGLKPGQERILDATAALSLVSWR